VALSRWLALRNTSLSRTSRADLLAFIAARAAGGSRPRSTARQLSSFRRFFRYLMREGAVREDPTAQIAMPRIGRSLPKSLTEAEVESLLMAPTVGDPLGHRDRTMLEVLYATGLRVSELVSLRVDQVNTTQGVLRVLGKGNRERLIPLGEEAVRWLIAFLGNPRAEIRKMSAYDLDPKELGGAIRRIADSANKTPARDNKMGHSRAFARRPSVRFVPENANLRIHGKLMSKKIDSANATHWMPNGRPIAKLAIITGDIISKSLSSLPDCPRLTNNQRIDSSNICPTTETARMRNTGAASIHLFPRTRTITGFAATKRKPKSAAMIHMIRFTLRK